MNNIIAKRNGKITRTEIVRKMAENKTTISASRLGKKLNLSSKCVIGFLNWMQRDRGLNFRQRTINTATGNFVRLMLY